MTGGCLDDAALAAHLDATCDEATRARVEAHLDGCRECRDVVAEYARTFLTNGEADEPSSRPVLAPGTRLGRYIVLGAAGEGAMGVVYAAHDTELDRKVALKLLRGEHDETRLLDEARLMAKLTHPSVIAVYDVDVAMALPFVVMELVEGPTLRAWCREKPRSPREVLRVFLDAARGLAAAHALGIVHRDIKPDNVLLGADGRARIADFGLAAMAGALAARPGIVDLEQPRRTRTGRLVGTPAYMAPEQLEGALGDACSDQFAFAVSLFEALTGERPFRASSEDELLDRIRKGEPSPARVKIAAWIRNPLFRALSVRPEERFASMDELVLALEAADPRKRLRRVALPFAIVALLASVALVAFATRRDASVCSSPGTSPWSQDTARSVERRFHVAAPSIADDAWSRVRLRLDTYAKELESARVQTCRATRVHGTQSARTMELRMQCLDRRHDELTALTRVLVEADDGAVRRAPAAVTMLTPIASCDETGALSSPVPIPDDPRAREEVAAIRTDLARSAALERAGNFREALDWTRPVVDRATTSSFLAVRAEALLRRGVLEDEVGDSKAARQTLFTAIDAAEAGRHDEVAAEGWIALVYVAGNQLEQHAEAALCESRAKAALARIGNPPRLRARLEHNAGAWQHQSGHFQDAVVRLRDASRLLENDPNASPAEKALTRKDLSHALREAGDVPAAIDEGTRALALAGGALGPAHPTVGEIASALGVALSRSGRFSEAVRAYERALGVQEAALGTKHPSVASTLTGLGLAQARSGQFEVATTTLDRALQIDLEVWGPDDSETATVEGNLGYVHLHAGNLGEARRQLERAIAVRERQQGKDHPFVARTLSNLGWVALGEGKTAEARSIFERALAILERAHGLTHPDVAAQLVGLGMTSLQEHAAAKAVPRFERALDVYRTAPPAPDKLADARFGLAQALVESGGDRTRATSLARDARGEYGALGRFTERKRLDVERWLAQHGS